MRDCPLCDAPATRRVATVNGASVVTFACEAHEAHMLQACANDDYEPLADEVRQRLPEVSAPYEAARALATSRVLALAQTERALLEDLITVLLAMPPGLDDTDYEWAVIDTIRRHNDDRG